MLRFILKKVREDVAELQKLIDENIQEEQLIGRAAFRIPFVGWAKLIFFEHLRPEGERGVCE